MSIKHVVLSLSSQDTLRFRNILLNEDKEEALTFLKDCLKPQFVEATRDH